MTTSSQQIPLWQACISAMDALLLAVGRRVTGGDGAHMRRLEEIQQHLDGEELDLFERLDTHRELRHEASYHVGMVSRQDARTTREDAEQLIRRARAFVEAG